MLDRKRAMYNQRRLVFVSVYLCISIAAADVLQDLGNFPICAQACWTEALTQCAAKCKLTDFKCICSCTSFQGDVKSCVSSSCASSHLQEVVDLITANCKVLVTTTSTSSPSSTSKASTSKITSTPLKSSPTSSPTTLGITTRILPLDTSISPGVFPPTATATSHGGTTPFTSPAGPIATSLGDMPPGGGPASIIGPACVPIHNQPNSSYPSMANWTNGIIFVNGTWRNSSCVAANGTIGAGGYGYEQVGVNEAALVRTGSWLAIALCVVMGLMVWFG